MKRLLITAFALALLCGRPAFAQVGMVTGAPASLGVTSPLGIGPGASVGVTGIPLGATELATPGVSGSASSSPSSMMSATSTACAGTQGAIQNGASGISGTTMGAGSTMAGESLATGVIAGASAPTPLFDGAGISGTASGTCASGTASSSPAGSASSPTLASRPTVGRVGIPMGSTELSTGGLSPLPDITLQALPPITSTTTSTAPCTMTGTSITSMSATGC